MKLLIADYAPTRIGIRAVLGNEWHIVAEADDADGAIAAAARVKPELCLVGLELPGGAVRAVREIRAFSPGTAVVALAQSPDPDDLLAVLRAGAVGYSAGGSAPEQLRRVLEAVAAGEAAIPRALTLELVRELQGASAGPEGLTTREVQVLGMLRRGQSTSAIGLRLGISPVTVRRHISTLVQKTGVADRAALTDFHPGPAPHRGTDSGEPLSAAG